MNGRPGWLQTMVARAQTTLATLLAWLNPAAAAAAANPWRPDKFLLST